MFCSQCGKADQVAGKYCRGCGTFLPDLSNRIGTGRYSLETTFAINAWMNIVVGVLIIIALPVSWWLFLKGVLSKHAFMLCVSTVWGGAFGGLLGNAITYFLFRRRFQRAPQTEAKSIVPPARPESSPLLEATTNDLNLTEGAETLRLDPIPNELERKIS
jgi:hypothetical protein